MSECSSCEQVKDWDALEDKRCLRHRLEGIDRSSPNHTNPDWNFIHPNLGPQPVAIRSKTQWKEELKKRGMVDDKAPRMDLAKFRNRLFDSKWDRDVGQAIDKAIAKVKQRPYSAIGKQFSQSEVHQMLRRESRICRT